MRQKLTRRAIGIILAVSSCFTLIGVFSNFQPARFTATPVTRPLSNFSQSQSTGSDGVTHYRQWRPTDRPPNLLWLTITQSAESWGKHKALVWTTERSFEDYLSLIALQVDINCTSLGLLTNSKDEFEYYKSKLRKHDFPEVNIFLHSGYDRALSIDRETRHDITVQTRRRAELARLRNYLMLQSLKLEEHILWLDADIFYLDRDIVRRMIRHSVESPDVGLLTARCEGKGIDDYDRNAWLGTREGPRGWDLDQDEIEAGELNKQGQKHIADLYKNTTNDELIPLTTVGATILYMRASLVHQGLTFPHQFVVGTRWQKNGWDGIESEGLCYLARGLDGGGCAFLGGSWHVAHTSN